MNNPSLDSLLLTLLATQTPEAIRTESDRTVLTFSAGPTKPGEYCQKVEVSRAFSFGRGGWFSLESPGQLDEVIKESRYHELLEARQEALKAKGSQ